MMGCVEKDVNSQMTKIISVTPGIFAAPFTDAATTATATTATATTATATTATAASTATGPTVNIMFKNTFTVNQRYFFENVDWGVMEEGEFFHDEQHGKLYVYPTASEAALLASHGAVAPVTDQLLEVRGRDVVLSNLTFLDTTYVTLNSKMVD